MDLFVHTYKATEPEFFEEAQELIPRNRFRQPMKPELEFLNNLWGLGTE